ncbi:MAG: ribosome silencing factor [Gammaproteobacteria bacterium]|nr:ribosome silencing factor [Gammaproteobacteria bacterium]MBL7000282.1 ribosome silencing factor [Gammaproteobacteria bacterium]
MTQPTTDKLQNIVINAMEDLKAEKIRHINLQGISGFTDRMIFASGNSNRHVKSIAQAVVEKMKQLNLPVIGMEGEDVGDWVLVDLGEIVVHVMLPATREFYDIERLWSDQAGREVESV